MLRGALTSVAPLTPVVLLTLQHAENADKDFMIVSLDLLSGAFLISLSLCLSLCLSVSLSLSLCLSLSLSLPRLHAALSIIAVLMMAGVTEGLGAAVESLVGGSNALQLLYQCMSVCPSATIKHSLSGLGCGGAAERLCTAG